MARKEGFTLIELSIVLVIIGLIVGGVLVGQDLIKASELRQTISTVEKLKTSFYTFRTKYNQYPGDITNATDFFTCAVVSSSFGGFNSSCNGNGDRRINGWPEPGSINESVITLEHLRLAGLVEKDINTAEYVHQTKYKMRFTAENNSTLGLAQQNHIRMNGSTGDDGAYHASDGLQIDQKADDGIANTGKVRAFRSTGPGNHCVGAARNYVSATDWNDKDSILCVMRFLF